MWGIPREFNRRLDDAPYFRAPAVTDISAPDDHDFVWLPSQSPGASPVEGVRRQVEQELGNRSSNSLGELTTIDDAFDQLSIPGIRSYF